ncbi:MAG: hypothetical protein CMJ46_04320 [Planctomyces sp.]|nr:hypothetical protein [Planctomyces sp.]
MKIEVVDRTKRMTHAFKKLCEQRVQSTFDRFRHAIHHISMTFSDVNGPRGGVDKSCRLMIDMDGSSVLVVYGRGEDFEKASMNVTRRSLQSITRSLQKASQFRRPPKKDLEAESPAVETA